MSRLRAPPRIWHEHRDRKGASISSRQDSPGPVFGSPQPQTGAFCGDALSLCLDVTRGSKGVSRERPCDLPREFWAVQKRLHKVLRHRERQANEKRLTGLLLTPKRRPKSLLEAVPPGGGRATTRVAPAVGASGWGGAPAVGASGWGGARFGGSRLRGGGRVSVADALGREALDSGLRRNGEGVWRCAVPTCRRVGNHEGCPYGRGASLGLAEFPPSRRRGARGTPPIPAFPPEGGRGRAGGGGRRPRSSFWGDAVGYSSMISMERICGGLSGLSLALRGRVAMASTTSRPAVAKPKMVYWGGRP